MATDPFTTLQKGKFSFDKVAKHPETLDLDEAETCIKQVKQNPSYITLKAVLAALETILVTQKQLLRELEEMKHK